MTEKEILISYGLLVITQDGYLGPWRRVGPREYSQGFSWSPDAVLFFVPGEFEESSCLFRMASESDPETIDPAAFWAIQLPFESQGAGVEVGTVSSDFTKAPLDPGLYSLVFEVLPGREKKGDELVPKEHPYTKSRNRSFAYTYSLTFRKTTERRYAILRAGSQITAKGVLVEVSECS